MGYRCMDCGHADDFEAIYEVKLYENQRWRIDEDGEQQEIIDGDCYDSETIDGPNEIECGACGSVAVQWIEDDEQHSPTTQKKKQLSNLIGEL